LQGALGASATVPLRLAGAVEKMKVLEKKSRFSRRSSDAVSSRLRIGILTPFFTNNHALLEPSTPTVDSAMAPSESSIISSFLLTPATLPSTISIQQFTALFPRAQQTNPQIRSLYRELQHQRAIAVDDVSQNIEDEAQRGKSQRLQIARMRKQSLDKELAGLDERDLMIEHEVLNPSSIVFTPRLVLTTF
jgi:Cnl2/NKP2 family protein